MLYIRTVEGVVDVKVPGTEETVEATLESCVFDGLVLKLEAGPHIKALHELITDGRLVRLEIVVEEKSE